MATNSVPSHVLGKLTGIDRKWYGPFLDLIVVDVEEDLHKARADWVLAATDGILDRTKIHAAINSWADVVDCVPENINAHWGYLCIATKSPSHICASLGVPTRTSQFRYTKTTVETFWTLKT